jgi:glutathionylspermidine synthase
MATSPELYQGIPTYYVELIKKGQEEIRHINARFNQLCGCLDFARQNKNEARINELNVELARLATEEARIKAKIKSYTTCQCTTCKM